MLKRLLRREKPVDDEQIPVEQAGPALAHYGAGQIGEERQQTGGAARPARRIRVRWGWLLGILALAAVALALSTDVSAWLPAEWLARWPLVVIGLGAVGLLAGMVASWGPGALGGPQLIALGGVGLLAQQGTAPNWMVIGGAWLAALGVGLVVRGLTMIRR